MRGVVSTQKHDFRAGLVSLDGAGARAFLGTLQAATELTTRCDAELRRAGIGIKTSDWDLLAMIAIYGPMRPTDLMAKSTLSGTPTTVSTILNRLETRGYLTRVPHGTDSRGVVVHLTTNGQALFDEAFPLLVNNVVVPFEANFTEADLQTLSAFWSRLQSQPPPGSHDGQLDA
jgi:DNA-binding MarR family transcriptional regulator